MTTWFQLPLRIKPQNADLKNTLRNAILQMPYINEGHGLSIMHIDTEMNGGKTIKTYDRTMIEQVLNELVSQGRMAKGLGGYYKLIK